MKIALLAIAAAALIPLAACSSGGGLATPTEPATTASQTTAAAPASLAAAVDPNVAACDDANTVMLKIKATFSGYDANVDEFDTAFASALRDEATELYGIEAKATGAAAAAMHAEATGLVDISIAIEGQDDAGLATAATASNQALAQLRGACNF